MKDTPREEPTGKVHGRGHSWGARYLIRRPPELTPEMASRRWRELNLLLHSAVLLHGDLEGKKPFLPILRSAGTIVAAPRGLLYLWDELEGALRLAVGFGFPGRVPAGLGTVNRMAAATLHWRKPILVNEPPEEELRQELRVLEAASCLTIPILKRGIPWGAVQLVRGEPFAEDEAILLWMYALIVEGTVPVLTEATHLPEGGAPRPVTPGLVDRQHFESTLDWEIERSGWGGRSCSLLRIGCRPSQKGGEPFPGHLHLERSLRAIRRSLRPVDSITTGDDGDLLIAMPDLDSLEAQRVAQTIRRNLLQSRALGDERHVLPQLKVAFATYPVHGRRREDLMRAVDFLFSGAGESSRVTHPDPLDS